MAEFGCKFEDTRSDVVKLHRLYWIYLGDNPRADLLSLPWWMREVAEMVDYFRGEQLRREHDERKQQKKRREMMDKAGIPL